MKLKNIFSTYFAVTAFCILGLSLHACDDFGTRTPGCGNT